LLQDSVVAEKMVCEGQEKNIKPITGLKVLASLRGVKEKKECGR
jgi:hypothetical protein